MSGALVVIPTGTAITAANAAGKIVVRDAVTGQRPERRVRRARVVVSYDPDADADHSRSAATTSATTSATCQRIADLQAAAHGGRRRASCFVHGFPRDRCAASTRPTRACTGAAGGVRRRRRGRAPQGARRRTARRTLQLAADAAERADPHARSPRCPAASDERIVVESHTDGMNAIWDNGPIAIARDRRALRVAAEGVPPAHARVRLHDRPPLPAPRCRPTASGGAEQYAKQLDEDYDDGTRRAGAARSSTWARASTPPSPRGGRPARPRARSRPAQQRADQHLRRREPGAGRRPSTRRSSRHDLRAHARAARRRPARARASRRTAASAARAPPYQQHMLPTIALVTGPWTLYNPAFGMEAVDGDADAPPDARLRRPDPRRSATVPREVLGGGYLGRARGARASSAARRSRRFGLVDCNGPCGLGALALAALARSLAAGRRAGAPTSTRRTACSQREAAGRAQRGRRASSVAERVLDAAARSRRRWAASSTSRPAAAGLRPVGASATRCSTCCTARSARTSDWLEQRRRRAARRRPPVHRRDARRRRRRLVLGLVRHGRRHAATAPPAWETLPRRGADPVHRRDVPDRRRPRATASSPACRSGGHGAMKYAAHQPAAVRRRRRVLRRGRHDDLATRSTRRSARPCGP